MMRFALLLLLPLLTACMGGGAGGGMVLSDSAAGFGGGPIGNRPTFDAPSNHRSFALLLNNERGERQVMQVTEDQRLNQAAYDHAQDMVAHGYLSHTDRS